MASAAPNQKDEKADKKCSVAEQLMNTIKQTKLSLKTMEPILDKTLQIMRLELAEIERFATEFYAAKKQIIFRDRLVETSIKLSTVNPIIIEMATKELNEMYYDVVAHQKKECVHKECNCPRNCWAGDRGCECETICVHKCTVGECMFTILVCEYKKMWKPPV